MENLDNNATQSEEVETSALPQADTEVSAALALFDLLPEQTEDTEPVDEEEDPPIDQEPERKGITVKYNKEDVFIDDDRVPELARRGLNYEKVEGRAKEYEAALDRAAKLNGYKDHAEYVADFDRLEQQVIQDKESKFATLKQELIDGYAADGYDPKQIEELIDNHPLFTEAKAVLDREKSSQDVQKQQQAEQEKLQGWHDLFAKYPQLTEELPEDGSAAPWFTPEMQRLVNDRNYDPVDAYRLIHSDKIIADERKRTEQDVIKQQRLNKRAKVEGLATVSEEAQVPKEISEAFVLFGLDPKEAKKYIKK
ncbi:hypothetical protein D3C81_173930 [compost metagenome]